MSEKETGIALLGFGTIGVGVVEILEKNADLLAERIGCRLKLRKIADIDLDTDRGVPIEPGILTDDAKAAIADPGVDIVIELIGGTTVAGDLILHALEQGKPVVTANKALLAERGAEIWRAAAARNLDVCFEASVCGAIPLIRGLREGLVANRIKSIVGILNGTCNYILTRMEREKLAFDEVLRLAQAAGYAEADPGLDIDGIDTAHKACILGSLAYGFQVPMDAVHVEGIRGLDPMDIEFAADLGYRIKLLAVIGAEGEEVDVRVHPALVSVDHMLASVSEVFNAVMIDGDMSGPTLYYGQGAGRYPTASSVVADLVDLARNLNAESPCRVPPGILPDNPVSLLPIGRVRTRYYLRFALLDKPGVLGQVGNVLGRHGVSIASVLQKESRAGEHVPVIVVTHETVEQDFRAALAEIDGTDITGAPTVCVRIEDL